MQKHNRLVLISLFCLSKICLAGYLTDETYKNGFFGKTLVHGTWHDDDGSTYTGYFKNEKAHGKGIYREANGNTYEGMFKNDKAHGYGTYSEPNGNVYKGMFKNDDFHGKGTWIETEEGATDGWPGTYKSDNWKNGELEGYGEYVGSGSKAGCSYKGNYVKGIENGYGKWTDPDGTWWEGTFKNGEWVSGTTNESN